MYAVSSQMRDSMAALVSAVRVLITVGGRVGPWPARVVSIASLISSRSSASSVKFAAPIHPSTCSADLAPTIAAVIPGQASVQAIATDDTVEL